MRYDAISRNVIFRNRDVVFPFFFFYRFMYIVVRLSLFFLYSLCSINLKKLTIWIFEYFVNERKGTQEIFQYYILYISNCSNYW